MIKKYNIAIVGATGAVGQKMLEVLLKRNFPVGELKLFTSGRSAVRIISFQDRTINTEVLKKDSFKGIDIAFFSAGSAISIKYAQIAVDSGAVVIDNSSAFRNDDNVPLVIPEINPDDIFLNKGIISNPNCTTAIMLTAINPIFRSIGIKKIIVSTYQSVSGAGMKGILELEEQMSSGSDVLETKTSIFPHKIAYNIIPHIDSFTSNGYTKEEMKMLNETRKILHDERILISATCVRVPVKCVHSMSVTMITEKYISVQDVRSLLSSSPGISVLDDPEESKYPMPINSQGKYDCFAGRIRKDYAFRNGISMWICGDQLLKGAALNAIQIAENLIRGQGKN